MHLDASAGVPVGGAQVRIAVRAHHLTLPVAFEESRVERARRVDGVLPSKGRVRRTH